MSHSCMVLDRKETVPAARRGYCRLQLMMGELTAAWIREKGGRWGVRMSLVSRCPWLVLAET
jgi:hypothetical protein